MLGVFSMVFGVAESKSLVNSEIGDYWRSILIRVMQGYSGSGAIPVRVVPDLKFDLRIRTGSGLGLSTRFRISGHFEKW